MRKYLTPIAFAVVFALLAFLTTTYLQSSILYKATACAVAGSGGAVCGYLLQSKS